MPTNLFKKFEELIRKEAYGDAALFIQQQLQHKPDNADLIGLRAVARFHQKDINCIADLDYAILLEPNNGYRYSSRAYIMDILGDTESAIKDYETAIVLDPQDHISLNNLGMLEEKLGRKQNAAKRFNKVDELLGIEKKHVPAFPPKIIGEEAKVITIKQVIKEVLTTKSGWLNFKDFLKSKWKMAFSKG